MAKNKITDIKKIEERQRRNFEEGKRLAREQEGQCGSTPTRDADTPGPTKPTKKKRKKIDRVAHGTPAGGAREKVKKRKRSKKGVATTQPADARRKMVKSGAVLNPPKPTLPRKLALNAECIVKLGNGCKVETGGLRDEHGVRYVWFRSGGRIAVMPYDYWHGGGGEGSNALRDAGIVIVGGIGEIRDAVLQLKKFRAVPIVTKPGWSRYGFVLADGRVLVPAGRPEPLKAFPPISGMLGVAGSLEGWIERVAAPLAGHELATFFMMMMFSPMLLDLINRPDNFGFELSGGAGQGKSTLQYLIASAAGPAIGGGDETYWRSLNTTMNALETVMAPYNDMALIMDEAGMVSGGGSTAARAISMRDMAFRMAAGQVKHRFGESAGVRSRLVFMLSTNRPIASLLGSAHGAEGEAIADRLITVPLLPERAHGIFDRCPPSYSSSGAFADDLKQAASEHYGHALPAFLQYLVDEKAKDETRLRARITAYVDEFVVRSGTNANDGSQTRVARALGLVYAAGRLARRAGVLPPSYRCGRAALAALRLHRTHGRAAVSFDDRLLALMRHPETVDLRAVELASLTKAQRAKCSVFLYTGRSGQRELLIPIQHIERVFPGWKAMTDDPDVEARLKVSKDRLVRERPVGRKGKQVACYVFEIADLEP